MEVRAEAFSVPKAGVSDAENEDAFCGSAFGEWVRRTCAFAVTDGATEASYSRLWSRLLAEAFTEVAQSDTTQPRLLDVAATAAGAWEREVAGRVLPWYAAEKAANGSFAAFVGVQLLDDHVDGETVTRWRAQAVGDCCMFVVRQGSIIERFPIQKSEEFGSSPYLLPTRRDLLDPTRISSSEGWCGCDDSIFMMSDALAAWFLREREHGGEPWVPLRDLGTVAADDFRVFVEDLRRSGELRNDDTTLVRIDVFK